jgi:pSer/pThr/pTyr-binding forkhead associated (FHA) protein
MRAAQAIRLSDMPPLPGAAAIDATIREGLTAGAGTFVSSPLAETGLAVQVALVGPRGRIEIRGPSAILGSDPQAAVPIQDPRVASAHAEITAFGPAAYIRDLGSDTGTWVNGSAVTTPKKLRDGDKLRLGSTEFTVRVQGGAEPTAAGPTGPSMRPAGEATAQLEVRSGRSLGLSFELVHSPTIIGRDPSATIRLDDEWIDACHARIRKSANGGWEIADAESHGVTKRNGVFLAPNHWVPLELGDVIEVGYVALAFAKRAALLPAQIGAASGAAPRLSGLPAPTGGANTPQQTPQQAPHIATAKSPSSTRARLWIRSGPGQGAFADLTDLTVVGNLAGHCTLLVADPQLAPRHVEISRLADGFYARDLGTFHGTVCRGHRLGAAPFKLQHGDVLLLGANVALLFEASA